jgi:hypothetical protein
VSDLIEYGGPTMDDLIEFGEPIEVDLCVDCILHDAGLPTEPDWGGMIEDWDGWLFGPLTDPDDDAPIESHFSWTPCDGCGTGLGGDRYPYLAVRR